MIDKICKWWTMSSTPWSNGNKDCPASQRSLQEDTTTVHCTLCNLYFHICIAAMLSISVERYDDTDKWMSSTARRAFQIMYNGCSLFTIDLFSSYVKIVGGSWLLFTSLTCSNATYLKVENGDCMVSDSWHLLEFYLQFYQYHLHWLLALTYMLCDITYH